VKGRRGRNSRRGCAIAGCRMAPWLRGVGTLTGKGGHNGAHFEKSCFTVGRVRSGRDEGWGGGHSEKGGSLCRRRMKIISNKTGKRGGL